MDRDIIIKGVYDQEFRNVTGMIQDIDFADKEVLAQLYDYKLTGMKEQQETVFECRDEFINFKRDPNSLVAKIEKTQKSSRSCLKNNK